MSLSPRNSLACAHEAQDGRQKSVKERFIRLFVTCDVCREETMSAVEYEVGRQPGPPDRPRIEVDPITLRVLGGAFHAVAKEMAGVLFRMSYSSIIRESEDLGAGIFDVEGREICESDTTPLHIGSLPWCIRGFMQRLEGDIEDGERDRAQPPVPRRVAHP